MNLEGDKKMQAYNFGALKDVLKDCKTHSAYDYTTKKTVKMFDCIISFDIETSNAYIGKNEKFAFMYIWQIGILNPNTGKELYFYGRTWQQFNLFIKHLRMILRLDDTRKVFIWVHNLTFEFQFIRTEIEGIWELFAGDMRKPYKAEIKNIVFRDTLILAGMSLSKVAENLTNHKIKKLLGDLDYNLIRHSKTPLSEDELNYCENDVKIVVYYIAEQSEIYGNLSKIPLTNTGRVRRFVREKCFYTSKNHKKSSNAKYKKYRELMNYLTLTERHYKLFNAAFQGGFTHANAMHVNKILNNVYSIDFTSSYPTVMIAEKFPMSPPKQITIKNLTEYDKLKNDDTGFIFVVRFTNLMSKILFENYLSESKAIDKSNLSVNNGRIFSADVATFVITHIDLDIIREVYSFDKIEFLESYTFYLSYLPTAIIKSILELYDKKTTLKGVDEKEVEYMLSKNMLNSIYGMSVTAIVRDEHLYNSDCGTWEVVRANEKDEIEKYNNNKKRFLYYPWGVFVTAYARKNLWKGILYFKEDYIYSDTDSIKFFNLNNHKKWIDKYNADITAKIKRALEFSCIEYKIPKTIKGIEKPLGVWDYEGEYIRFKTLGAKRYMYETKDGLHITVAGLSKKQGKDYIANQPSPFKFFEDNMYIPKEHTSKLTHTYIDCEQTAEIKDYLGKIETVTEKSSVHLEKCEFTLSQSKSYIDFLNSFINGYLDVGLSYDM